jgi:serine/threonine protein kinase
MIGEGGFGRTYSAYDKQSDDWCVVKELLFTQPSQHSSIRTQLTLGWGNQDIDTTIQGRIVRPSSIFSTFPDTPHQQVDIDGYTNPKRLELFEREAEALRKIEHAQVPRFYEAFHDQDRHFIVQEFIHGFSCQQLWRSNYDFNLRVVISLLWDILRLLHCLHAHKVIHRDISPDNIIICPRIKSSRAVLIDFGIVKLLEETKHINGFPATGIGKKGYAPSEQISDGECNYSSDIYSLGTTVIALLVKKQPQEFLSNGPLAWQRDIQNQHKNVNKHLLDILARMVANPKNRYQSTEQVEEALKRARILHPLDGPNNNRVDSRMKFPLVKVAGLVAALVGGATILYKLNVPSHEMALEPDAIAENSESTSEFSLPASNVEQYPPQDVTQSEIESSELLALDDNENISISSLHPSVEQGLPQNVTKLEIVQEAPALDDNGNSSVSSQNPSDGETSGQKLPFEGTIRFPIRNPTTSSGNNASIEASTPEITQGNSQNDSKSNLDTESSDTDELPFDVARPVQKPNHDDFVDTLPTSPENDSEEKLVPSETPGLPVIAYIIPENDDIDSDKQIPLDPWNEAIRRSNEAHSILAKYKDSSSRLNYESWKELRELRKTALELLEDIPEGHEKYQLAQSKITEYQNNLDYTDEIAWHIAQHHGKQANSIFNKMEQLNHQYQLPIAQDIEERQNYLKSAITWLQSVSEGHIRHDSAQSQIAKYEGYLDYSYDRAFYLGRTYASEAYAMVLKNEPSTDQKMQIMQDKWQSAIDMLRIIPEDHEHYEIAQNKIFDYGRHL